MVKSWKTGTSEDLERWGTLHKPQDIQNKANSAPHSTLKMKKKRSWITHAYELSILWTEQNENLDFSLYTGANQACSKPVEQPLSIIRQLPDEVLIASGASTIIHI